MHIRRYKMAKSKYERFDIKTLKFLLKRKKIRVKCIGKEISQIEKIIKKANKKSTSR